MVGGKEFQLKSFNIFTTQFQLKYCDKWHLTELNAGQSNKLTQGLILCKFLMNIVGLAKVFMNELKAEMTLKLFS